MKSHPILFKGAMVREIIARRKTQTRRLIRPNNSIIGTGEPWENLDFERAYPDTGFGHPAESYLKAPHVDGETTHRVWPRIVPDDLLWVKETWRAYECPATGVDGILFQADDALVAVADEQVDAWLAAHDNGKHGDNWRPSIFLPKWAPRLFLTVGAVRPERLLDITDEDARAEGFDSRAAFLDLFRAINPAAPPNPWVWAYTFAETERPAGWPS